MRTGALFGALLAFSSWAVAAQLELAGQPRDWLAGIDRGGTKMTLLRTESTLAVEIDADGQEEDYPKIRRTFDQPQDWQMFSRLYAKLRVTCDDPNVRYKRLAFVFYNEQTRLPDYPGQPMKQQVIARTIPVGRWIEIVAWLAEIHRATIRQFDIYLYELPPSTAHKFKWEINSLLLQQVGGETVVFDGLIFPRQTLTVSPGRPIGNVRTKDGLQLTFDDHGGILSVVDRGNVLGRSTSVAPTGILVRDVTRVTDPPTMVRGQVKQVGEELRQVAKLDSLGLEVTAVYQNAGDYIQVSGRVADLRKADRAVTVYLALPVAKDKWRWWDRASVFRSEAGESGELCYLESGVQFGLNGAHSKYPIGALTLPEKGGLTLAVRMDEPVVHRIAYAPELSLFYIALDFGLVPERRTDGTALWEAPFRFLVYRHNPAWGFRSALQRYYDFFPQFFTKRVRKEGGWYVWGNMADTPDALKAGFAFHWGPADAKAVKWDNANGALALFYIESQTYQQSHQDFEAAPTHDQVVERLRKLAAGEAQELGKVAATSYRVYPLAPTGGDVSARIRETAQVVSRSMNYDSFGQPYISVGRYGWMQNRWGAIISCNLLPSLPEGKGWFNIHRLILPAIEAMEKEGANYDGLALDSLGGYGEAQRVNYRREHFGYSRFPLSFSAFDYQPVQVAFFTTVEWLRELSRLLHPRGMVLMANCSWGSTPGWLTFAAPYLDIFGAEHPFFADADFIRAIACRKPCTDLPYDPRPEWEVDRHLLHAIFPGHGNNLQSLQRHADSLWRLTNAGWEPITGVHVAPTTVQAERFGRGQEIFIVLHNPAEEAVDAQITVDRSILGSVNLTSCQNMCCSPLAGSSIATLKETPPHLRLEPRSTVVLCVEK